MKDLRINRTGTVILCALATFVLLWLVYYSRSGYVEETIKISELLSASIYLAEEGGRKVVAIRSLDDSKIGQLEKGQTNEGAKDYVTMGDQLSHEIITSGLKAGWPNLLYQSEEADRKVTRVPPPPRMNRDVKDIAKRDEEVPIKAVTVWIDPLDATQEYTEGRTDPDLLDYVTVMVCIAIGGKPIAGVIHQPFIKDRTGLMGVTKWAWVGHGLSKSIIEATSSAQEDPKKVRVIASRSHPGEVFTIALNSFKGSKNVELIKAAGAGYKALAVAEGTADLYLHTTAIKKWDICAGNALLNAMGGRMTTRKGEEIDYKLEGNPKNEDGLVAVRTEANYREYAKYIRT